MSSLDLRVEKSKLLANWIGDRTDNLELAHNPKIHVPAICFHVALTHHTAIIALIGESRSASGLALLRPLMESYLRGAWVYHFADQVAIDRFVRGQINLKINDVIADLETVEAFDQKRLSAIKKEVWSDLCDFTHCGGKTIFAHYAGSEIRPIYGDAWLIQALVSADSWALMSGLALVLLADRIDLGREFLTKSNSLVHSATI